MTATRRRGFTMIELIIVIVILGILAAIAIVGYRAVIDNTRWASIEQTAHTVGREAAALAAFGTEDDPLGVALSDLPEDVEREQVSATVAEIAQDGRCVRIETLDDGEYELTRACTALTGPGDPGDDNEDPEEEIVAASQFCLTDVGNVEVSFRLDADRQAWSWGLRNSDERSGSITAAFTDEGDHIHIENVSLVGSSLLDYYQPDFYDSAVLAVTIEATLTDLNITTTSGYTVATAGSATFTVTVDEHVDLTWAVPEAVPALGTTYEWTTDSLPMETSHNGDGRILANWHAYYAPGLPSSTAALTDLYLDFTIEEC